MTRYLDAGLDVLDRHIVDADGESVGKVDDLELAAVGGDAWEVRAILIGPEAYGRRLGGRIGRWITRLAHKFADTEEPIRIPVELVDDLGVTLKLRVPLRDLGRAGRVDRWLGDNFVGRIPGGRDAPQ